MTLNGRSAWWVGGCCLVAIIAFAAGVSIGQRAMLKGFNIQVDSVQSSLAFNRLFNERHWKELLSKGCVAQTIKALDVAEDKDMELLAEYIHGRVDAAALEYISDRDPGLIQQLNTFKSKYGSRWSEDDCPRR